MYLACRGGLFELFRIARSDNGHIRRSIYFKVKEGISSLKDPPGRI
jgi:hypothetical protein